MEYCLDETTASKYYQFGVNVFGIDDLFLKWKWQKRALKCAYKINI